MDSQRLLAIGGAHIDRRGRVRGPHLAEASNPGSMREEVGGGTFNAARAAVQRGISVQLMSLRGGDPSGEKVAEAIEEAGIVDFSAVFLDRQTPSYTAILTQEGDLVTGLADMELYDIGFPKQIRRRKIRDAVAAADAVLCDANMPVNALEGLAALSDGKPLFAVAISPAKADRLRPVLASLSCLFMNRQEALSLAGLSSERQPREAGEILARIGLRRSVITAGSAPAICFDGNMCMEIAPAPVGAVADVTGAGDALAGACIAALMLGQSFAEAVREGMVAAKLTLESETAAPKMDAETFRAALALVPQPRELA